MDKDTIFLEEEKHLADTREWYDRIAAENQVYFDKLPWLYPREADILMRNELMAATHNRIVRLRQDRDKPYFARIDFTPEETASPPDHYYLGKIGVLDGEDRIVTLDWRAPIATLYYDSNVGPVAYEAPGGQIAGRLELKRQLEVERGRLLSCNDVDTVANDELLRPYLGVNADNRLKNIIATIQTEQNRIIREKLDANVVVQGVAGSGKTTVALHRIAYLVYTYRESIQPGQYMVIGPNRFFISYISSVLPDLDVDSVPQFTYEELTREILGEDYHVTEASAKLAQVIAGKATGEVERHKTSLAYKEALDRFLPHFQASLLPQEDFIVGGCKIVDREKIADAWQSAMDGVGGTLKARVEQCILYLQVRLGDRRLLLEREVSEHYKALYRDREQDLDKLHKERTRLEKELESSCAKSLRAFFAGVDAKILSVYRLFIQNAEQFLDPAFPAGEALKKQTLSNLRKRRIDPEDQPALLYLLDRIRGADRYKAYRHAVIDEAQDFGEFDFFALQRILGGCTFTVVGDLAQSIYRYRGIDNWQEVLTSSFEKPAVLREMFKSYRTTVEIMEAANHVTAALGMPPTVPVIRHGEPVRFHKAGGTEALEIIRARAAAYLAEGRQSIALLAKTDTALEPICHYLCAHGIPVEISGQQSKQYTGGLCAMPGYLSKGLEFDVVILCDASDKVYRAENLLDLHLLYVEMTRPLHCLEIVYDRQITKPLKPLI
jgi:DNA helicase-2/ATP-dependent DNA helicase PcrA